MPRTLTTVLVVAVLCSFSTSPARAAGLNLYWNDCSVGGAATTNRDFACNTNQGFNDLYISYSPPPEITEVDGVEERLDLQSASPTLPDWWRFKNAGSCRLTALTFLPSAPSACPDPWAGQGVGGIGAYYVSPDIGLPLDRARLVAVQAVPTGTPMPPLVPTTEYFAAVIRISNAKTVGSNGCAGCATSMCIVLSTVGLYPPGATQGTALFSPISNNFVSWQGGAGGNSQCHGAAPATNHTWGQIKAIYR